MWLVLWFAFKTQEGGGALFNELFKNAINAITMNCLSPWYRIIRHTYRSCYDGKTGILKPLFQIGGAACQTPGWELERLEIDCVAMTGGKKTNYAPQNVDLRTHQLSL